MEGTTPVSRRCLRDFYEKEIVAAKSAEERNNERQNLRELVMRYLDAVDPSKRLNPLISCTLELHSKRILSWQKVSEMMWQMERYTLNLLDCPWKKEFREIRMYSGFYKTHLEACLPGVALEKLFSLLSYRRKSNCFVICDLPSRGLLIEAALDFCLAAVECETYDRLHEVLESHGFTALGAMTVRLQHRGTLSDCSRVAAGKGYSVGNELTETPDEDGIIIDPGVAKVSLSVPEQLDSKFSHVTGNPTHHCTVERGRTESKREHVNDWPVTVNPVAQRQRRPDRQVSDDVERTRLRQGAELVSRDGNDSGQALGCKSRSAVDKSSRGHPAPLLTVSLPQTKFKTSSDACCGNKQDLNDDLCFNSLAENQAYSFRPVYKPREAGSSNSLKVTASPDCSSPSLNTTSTCGPTNNDLNLHFDSPEVGEMRTDQIHQQLLSSGRLSYKAVLDLNRDTSCTNRKSGVGVEAFHRQRREQEVRSSPESKALERNADVRCSSMSNEKVNKTSQSVENSTSATRQTQAGGRGTEITQQLDKEGNAGAGKQPSQLAVTTATRKTASKTSELGSTRVSTASKKCTKMNGRSAKSAAPKSSRHWQCKWCTLDNETTDVMICSACNRSQSGDNEGDLPLQPFGQQCNSCTFVNSSLAETCEMCCRNLKGSSTYV